MDVAEREDLWEGSLRRDRERRRREVSELVRTGLQDALEALEGDVEDLGTSGYEVREDVLHLPVAS